MDPIAVGVVEAAALLGISKPTLYRHARDGRITLRKVAGRTLVEVTQLPALIETAPRVGEDPKAG